MKYSVRLSRTIEHVAHVSDVEAANADEAIEKAIVIADAPRSGLWAEGDTLGESSKATREYTGKAKAEKP